MSGPIVAGYTPSPWGQVHYRRCGDSGPWVVLFHESPLSSEVFQDVLPLLGRSVRAVAFDTPGYGASSPPPDDTTEIPRYARVLVDAATELGVHRPVLAGVHTGASIAIEAAHALRGGVSGLALTGVALLTEKERADYLAGGRPPCRSTSTGPSSTWAVERYRRIWPDLTTRMLHLAVVELLRTGERYDWAYRAAFRHDPAEPLRSAPGQLLLLDPEFDLLADKDAVAMDLRPDAELTVMPGLQGQPHLRAPGAYAAALAEFARRTSGESQP